VETWTEGPMMCGQMIKTQADQMAAPNDVRRPRMMDQSDKFLQFPRSQIAVRKLSIKHWWLRMPFNIKSFLTWDLLYGTRII
jgi:hypothetical protein